MGDGAPCFERGISAMTASPAILVVVAAALIGIAVVVMRLLIAGGVIDLANAHSLRRLTGRTPRAA